MGLGIVNGTDKIELPEKYEQLAIKKGIEYNVTPSLFICQWWFESNFGTTSIALNNNNWGGTSYFYSASKYKRPSGVTVYRGTKRPKQEGAYYMKFTSIDDYMIDYFYLLLEGGTYDVRGHNDFKRSVQGLFRPKAKANYAGSGYGHYLETMLGIRRGINKRNNNILDKIDSDPEKYYKGETEPPKPSKPIEVPPTEDKPSQIIDKFESVISNMLESVNNLLTIDLVNFDFKGNSFGNKHIKVIRQMDNTYKIKPTLTFENTFKDLFTNGIDILDDTLQGLGGRPETEVEKPPPPVPDGEKCFPVNYNNEGINFWKKSNWKMGQLQYQMCYGYTRENGRRFHSGYDIGSGGRKGNKVYATTNGTVNFVKWSDSGGFMIQIKHDSDNYYSTYLHLENNSNVVKKGDKVKAGQQIATMGNTPGGGMAIHLHYVLSRNPKTYGEENTLDPEKYLGITDDNKTTLRNPE